MVLTVLALGLDAGVALAAAPSVPQNVSAARATSQALVTWTAPAATGGSMTGYTITVTPAAGRATTVPVNNGSATGATVTGLTNGTPYTLRSARPMPTAPARPRRRLGGDAVGHPV